MEVVRVMATLVSRRSSPLPRTMYQAHLALPEALGHALGEVGGERDPHEAAAGTETFRAFSRRRP